MAESQNDNKQEIAREEFKVRGKSIVIAKVGDREFAQVDGRSVEYYTTPDGYLLKSDVFRKPAKSLRAAIKRYLEDEAKR